MQQEQNGSVVEPVVSIVTLSKLSGRALNASQRDKQLAVLISTVLNVKTARAGWNLEIRPNSVKTVELGGNDYRNGVSLNLWNSKPEAASAKTTEVVIRQIHAAGGASSGSNKWRVAEVDGVTWDAPERDAEDGEAVDPDKELVTYADCFIPDNADFRKHPGAQFVIRVGKCGLNLHIPGRLIDYRIDCRDFAGKDLITERVQLQLHLQANFKLGKDLLRQ